MPIPISHPKRGFKTREAAAYCGISTSLLHKMRMDPEKRPANIPDGPKFIQLGPKTLIYLVEDLDQWIESHKDEGSRKTAR